MGMRLGCHKNKLYNVHICGEMSVIVKEPSPKGYKTILIEIDRVYKKEIHKKEHSSQKKQWGTNFPPNFL